MVCSISDLAVIRNKRRRSLEGAAPERNFRLDTIVTAHTSCPTDVEQQPYLMGARKFSYLLQSMYFHSWVCI